MQTHTHTYTVIANSVTLMQMGVHYSSAVLKEKRRALEDIKERELGIVGLKQVRQEADGSRPPLKQAEGCVGAPRPFHKFLCLHEFRELEGAVDELAVAGEAVREKEDVAVARDPVADAGAFPQEPLLPGEVGALPAGDEMHGVLPQQEGFGEEIDDA